MLLYILNLKDSIKKLLELIDKNSKAAVSKSIYRNQLCFYIMTIKYLKNK